MDKSKVVIMLDNGHGNNTPGKRSPDSELREYAYVREIVKLINEALTSEGYNVYIVTPEETDTSLSTRVNRINAKYAEAKRVGKTGFAISVHNNAAGNGSWMNATGWSVFLSPNASNNSKNLAGYLYDAAKSLGCKVRVPLPNQKYWVSNLYICKNTNCPCVLTENFFMDSKTDKEWLLTEEGRRIVAQIHIDGIKEYIKKL